MDKPTPRINAGMIQQYTNSTVRLVGRVVQECTHNAQFIELLGKVQGDGSVNGFTATDLSDNFDLQAYGLFEKAARNCPDLFA
ncbi:hypothetical protein GGH19_004243 [Coemansia sp. RSA 1807]|nr:hypothetical protein GGH19_004243 [Coemansia sp. RSA 1807]